MNTRWGLFWGGIVDVLFGVFLLTFPAETISLLLLFFGIYAALQGLTLIAAAFGAEPGTPYRGWLATGGVLSLILGVVALFYREAALAILVYFIIFRAFFVGVTEFVASIKMRKEIKGEFLLGLAGVLNILFGLYLLFYPATSLALLILILGWYSIIVGAILLLRGILGRGTKTATNPL